MKLFAKCDKKEDTAISADKIFMRSFVISILGALMCIIALSTSTWAWFEGSINSDTNRLEVASCEIAVSVKDKAQTATASAGYAGEKGNELTDDDGIVYSLTAGNTYSVTLVPGGSATTCYCRIIIGNSEYVTQQIAINANDGGITFDLTCDADTDVTILRRWGEAKEDSSSRAFVRDTGYTYNVGQGSLATNPKS